MNASLLGGAFSLLSTNVIKEVEEFDFLSSIGAIDHKYELHYPVQRGRPERTQSKRWSRQSQLKCALIRCDQSLAVSATFAPLSFTQVNSRFSRQTPGSLLSIPLKA